MQRINKQEDVRRRNEDLQNAIRRGIREGLVGILITVAQAETIRTAIAARTEVRRSRGRICLDKRVRKGQ